MFSERNVVIRGVMQTNLFGESLYGFLSLNTRFGKEVLIKTVNYNMNLQRTNAEVPTGREVKNILGKGLLRRTISCVSTFVL